jgi:hypothetical protein
MDKNLYDSILKIGTDIEKTQAAITVLNSTSRDQLNDLIQSIRILFDVGIADSPERITEIFQFESYNDYKLSLLYEHWQIYLASIVKTKQTIKLDTSNNLSVHHLFGLKKHRCWSAFNLFSSTTYARSSVDYPKFTENKVLECTNQTFYDLGKMFSNKHIDQTKLPELFELTSDICKLTVEKKSLLSNVGIKTSFDFVKDLASDYHRVDFVSQIKKIPEYYDIYTDSVGKFQAIDNKKKSLEDKWDLINKNYKLFIKLSNKHLKM